MSSAAARATASAWRIDPQDVAARELGEVLVAPAAPDELGEEPRVAGHVLEPLGPGVVAVVVAAEADVIDAGDLAHVVDVVGHLGDRDLDLRHAGPDLAARGAVARRGRSTPFVRSSYSFQSGALARANSCETKAVTNVTITTPPFSAEPCSTSSGTLRGWSQRARAEECEKITGASDDAQRVLHGVRRDVRQVDQHARAGSSRAPPPRRRA